MPLVSAGVWLGEEVATPPRRSPPRREGQTVPQRLPFDPFEIDQQSSTHQEQPQPRRVPRPLLLGDLTSGLLPVADSLLTLPAWMQPAGGVLPRLRVRPVQEQAQTLAPPGVIEWALFWDAPQPQPFRPPRRPALGQELTSFAAVLPDDAQFLALMRVQDQQPRIIPRGRREPGGDLPRLPFVPDEPLILSTLHVSPTLPIFPVRRRPEPSGAALVSSPLIDLPGYPLWTGQEMAPAARYRVPKREGGTIALLPLPDFQDGAYSAWNLTWPTSPRRTAFPVQLQPTSERSSWWPSLAVELLYDWGATAGAPIRKQYRALPGSTDAPATQSPRGEPMAWDVPPVRPRPLPHPAPWLTEGTVSVSPQAVGLITVSGPYYVVSGEIFVAGAILGAVRPDF